MPINWKPIEPKKQLTYGDLKKGDTFRFVSNSRFNSRGNADAVRMKNDSEGHQIIKSNTWLGNAYTDDDPDEPVKIVNINAQIIEE